MILATCKQIPVRVIAWSESDYAVTVEVIANGRVRCLPVSDLRATEGPMELSRVLAAVEVMQTKLERRP